MQYSIAHNTHIGSRQTNQDRVAYSENKNGILMVIADGLGGYAGGEMAAQTVVECLIGSFDKLEGALVNDPAAFLVLSMTYAHTLIGKKARKLGLDSTEPRTTCVACLVQNGYAYWGHVGDSRLYLFSDGELLTRTVDHTTSDHMHQDGAVDEQTQRLGHSQLFRCVGGARKPVVSLGAETQLGTGDTIFLCTDGVWRAFKEYQLGKVSLKPTVAETVDILLSHSRRYFRGECDNVTALSFRWNDAPTQQKPLLNLTTPELDQDGLWAARQQSAQDDSALFSAHDKADEGMESMIEEIETLVGELSSSSGSKNS